MDLLRRSRAARAKWLEVARRSRSRAAAELFGRASTRRQSKWPSKLRQPAGGRNSLAAAGRWRPLQEGRWTAPNRQPLIFGASDAPTLVAAVVALGPSRPALFGPLSITWVIYYEPHKLIKTAALASGCVGAGRHRGLPLAGSVPSR